ncbi:MAG TPA: serine/threonine-protein kinase, partial [Polyangiaceae bacterium LLY-WYZ-15_(1-7)]|nr:serine/threonine-protein kinase [Polyangiaceae bacterium LLY-WYZ-15_(1-7)]
DMKPANVLITKHGDEEDFVKVLDFGLVKNVKENQELTQQGLFMGSPKYMSPEQIQGGDVDGRTDVYSLGVILYYMMTGKVPFEGTTQVQTLMAHIKKDVPPMEREDGVPIPPEVQQVVLKCLHKDHELRFASMNDVILALKQASGLLGAPMSSSQSISVSGEYDLSGVRHMPATPSGGIQITGTPASGVGAVPEVELPEVEEQKGGKGKLIFIVAAIALLGVGGWAMFGRGGEPPPETNSTASNETEPSTMEATPEVEEPTAMEEEEASATAMEEEEAEVAETAMMEQAPLARCEVTLRSSPPGAEVFVGERSYGETPASVVWVGEAAEPGREVTFRFERRGYRTTSVTRTVTGETLEVDADMPRERPRWTPMRSTMSSMSGSEMSDPEFGVTPTNYRDNPY